MTDIKMSKDLKLGNKWRNCLMVLTDYLQARYPELSNKEASLIAVRSIELLKKDAKQLLKQTEHNSIVERCRHDSIIRRDDSSIFSTGNMGQ